MLSMLTMMCGPALADVPSSGTADFVLGVGAVPGTGDPSSLRIGLRGELTALSGDVGGIGVVLPVEFGSSSDQGFGIETRNSALEIAPSVRLRLFPEFAVRPYLDLGLGLVHRFGSVDTWFGSAESNRTTFMARSALGVAIGGSEPSGVALILEPIGYRHYGLNRDDGADVYAAMAGIQVVF